MILAMLLALQDRVEMKDHGSHYLIEKPAGYADTRSWPAVVELHDEAEPSEQPARKAIAGWKAAPGRGFFVIAPQARTARWGADPAFVKACLDDAKTRYRLDPLRVLVAGTGCALEWATANGAAVAGCFLREGKAPERGFPVLAGGSPEGALAWFARTAPARSSLDVAQALVKDGRWLDASLVCADLMEMPEWARLGRFQMSRVEGEGIMALGKVELAMTERRYLDAWARCRDAAVQFTWVPAGERIQKRLAQLEADPRVRAARQLDD